MRFLDYYNSPWYYIQQLANAIGETDIATRCQLAASRESMNENYELDKLKKEIADDVLSRISVSVDTTDAIKQIKSLKEALNQLGK